MLLYAERCEKREKAILLDENLLKVEKKRAIQDSRNKIGAYNLQVERINIDKRRLQLDEQLFQIGKEERSAQIDQSKELAVLPKSIADKIN